jgi:predicted ArsR family transcriptional regulator
MRMVKQATGRPYHAYHPTERAVGAMTSAHADLLERMLRSLGEREDVIAQVMTSVAEALAQKHRAEVPASMATAERVGHVTASLRQEGILESWRAADDGFHLVNGTCPYRKAAEISPLPCESDRKAIELLLGLDVEQLNRIVDGSPICEYLVRRLIPSRSNLLKCPRECDDEHTTASDQGPARQHWREGDPPGAFPEH